MSDDPIRQATSIGFLTPDNPPAMLDYFGQMLKRGHEHRSLPAPLLDAILPILEYTPKQLERGGFMEDWLTAALKAHVRIKKAAAYLEPLGIRESDLCVLLRDRMKERLRVQRKQLRKFVNGGSYPDHSPYIESIQGMIPPTLKGPPFGGFNHNQIILFALRCQRVFAGGKPSYV